MNIQEMHTAFRVLGQQMGMQLVRGILPESIDLYINNVITEKTQQELLNGVRTALQDSVNTQASTMSVINTFRSLYRNARFSIDTSAAEFDNSDDSNNYNTGIYKVAYYNALNGYHVINIPTAQSSVEDLGENEYKIVPMLFLGFSVEYENTLRGNPVACRLIGSDVLETTLRDYCNGASKDSPIAVLNSVPQVLNSTELVNSECNEQVEIHTSCKNCSIKYLNIKYIKVPNVVRYNIDLSQCINCDLPDYTHFEIVERAVMKYYASVGATSGNASQASQQQSAQQRQ